MQLVKNASDFCTYLLFFFSQSHYSTCNKRIREMLLSHHKIQAFNNVKLNVITAFVASASFYCK